LNLLEFVLLLLLELHFGVHGQLGAAAKSLGLRDVSWVVVSVLVVSEGVLVCWLGTESSRWLQLDSIRVRSESVIHLGNTLLQGFRLLTVLLELVGVRNQVITILFVLLDFNLITHAWLDSLLESLEVDVALLLRVEHIVHQGDDFFLACENLVSLEMLLEILIRDETIIVDVHLLEHLVETWFRIEDLVLNLYKQISHALVSVIVTVVEAGDGGAEFIICLNWWWVCSHSSGQNGGNLVWISFINLRCNFFDVGGSMIVESKSRDEALHILLVDLSVNQFLTALVHNESNEILLLQVSVSISTSLLLESFSQTFLIFEFVTHKSVHFNDALLSLL